MKIRSISIHLYRPESGMVLLFCLLFLTAMTLLGLSASADAILQNQLAANLRETEQSKQSALVALEWAEDWLLSLQGEAPEPCVIECEGLKLHPVGALLPHAEYQALDWWQTQGYEAGLDPFTGSLLISLASNNAAPSMWIVELLHQTQAAEDGSTCSQSWYRILARGSGHTNSAVSVVESRVIKTWLFDEGSPTPDNHRIAWRELR